MIVVSITLGMNKTKFHSSGYLNQHLVAVVQESTIKLYCVHLRLEMFFWFCW